MLNSLTKNSTLITGLLIFLGYCKYHFFYGAFDIEIYNYISAPELILSFFPVIVSYFIPIVLLIYALLIFLKDKDISPSTKELTKRIERKQRRNRPIHLVKFLFYRRIKFKEKIKILLEIFFHREFIMFGILFWITIIIFIDLMLNATLFKYESMIYVIIFLWFYTIIEPIILYTASQDSLIQKLSKNHIRQITIMNIFLIVTFYIYLSQNINAIGVLTGKKNNFVSLILNSGDTLTTSNTVLLIGQSKDYIFFRNLNDSTNTIIKTIDISKIRRK